MKAFDQDEKIIRQAISNIHVDTRGLSGQIKNRLNEPVTVQKQKRIRRPLAVAAVLSVMLVVTVAAAEMGTFTWFMEKFNPSFSEVVAPVEAYAVDQGIRMEVIGAQKFDNQAVVYLSLQDITGQNRLTEQTEFRDGFSIKIDTSAQEASGDSENAVSYGWRKDVLFFDEQTNTIYYEFIISSDSDSPIAEPLTLGSFLIYFDEEEYEFDPIPVNLAELGEVQTAPVIEDNIMGGTDVPEDFEPDVVLQPGYYGPMPHGKKDQWISNIGFVDGKLHVQIAREWHKEFGSSDLQLNLMDADGELLFWDYGLMLLGDEDHNLLYLEENAYAHAAYKYEEIVFTIAEEDLDKYTLCYTGFYHTGVEGRWKVSANISDNHKQMRVWTNDIVVEGLLFEHLTLSPLGLQVIGSYEGRPDGILDEMAVAIETSQGLIAIEGGGGSRNSEKKTFHYHWSTEMPLDVSAATAVVLNGVRIPID